MQSKINMRLFIAYSSFVLIPLLVIILYLTLFAKDRYESSSVILVKQVSDSTLPDTNGLTALLGVPNTSTEDSHILKEYIISRDMVEKLDHSLNLRKEFNVAKDPIFALKKDATIEELVEYFNKVSSQGFSPEFSLKLNQALLKQSDAFINDISQNIAMEQQKFAEKQLVDSTLQLKQARDTLLDYQNKNEIFDPELQAKAVATLISGCKQI